MKILRGLPREGFDVVCYAPWASSLVGGSRIGGTAAGGETQLFLLASGLAERGLHVGMIVMGSAKELPASTRGVRILPQAPRSQGPLARAALARGAFRSMTSVRTDVLIQRNAGPATALAALAARRRGARFVYSSASLVDFEFASFEQRAVNVRLYEWGVRSASEVVVQTDDQARLCRTHFRREPLVIRSIANRTQPRTERPEAFLWVGRLQSLKRPDSYLELARAIPEARFWMIAVPQADESSGLRRRVHDALAELPNLQLLEPRSTAGIGDLLERTVAIVNTSEREGMPNVFLEGWARGVPALALSFDPDSLIARHGLGSFAYGDPARFADQARRLWRERDDQAELADRCIAYVQAEHDKDAIIDRWLGAIVRTS